MRRSAKTMLTTLLCGAMIASAASCAASQTYPLTIDGEKIRAGIYILEQQTAISEAKNKLSEEQPDLDTSADGFNFLDQTVEGKKFEDWVNDKAVEYCRNYVATGKLFNDYGLTLDPEDISSTDSYVKQLWTEENAYAQYIYGVKIIGEYYEKLGVGEQSFKDLQYMSYKREDVFDYLYGENGIQAATQEEINESLKTDYIAVNFFEYQLENGTSAQELADRIKNGDSYEAVYRDYSVELNKEKAEKAAAESAAADEEAAAQGLEVVNDDGTDDSENEQAEQSTGDETAANTAETAEVPLPATDSLVKIIKNDSEDYEGDFVAQAFAMSNNEVKVLTVTDEEHTHVYVVQKLDILEKTELTAETIKTVRSDLKQDEFEELIKSTGASLSLSEDSSKNMYKVKTLLDSRSSIY